MHQWHQNRASTSRGGEILSRLALLRDRNHHSFPMKNLLIIVAGLVLLVVFVYEPERRWPPGMMINSDPDMGRLTRGPVWVKRRLHHKPDRPRTKSRARVLCVNHQ